MAHDDAQPLSVAGSVPIMERLLNDQTLATAIRRGCSVDAGTIDANSLKMIDGAIDVAEMSLATFVKVQEEGFPVCCLPIFPGRGFPHSEVMAKADAGFRDMSDLRGTRVGLSQFWTTANVWRRLVLSHQYGVPDMAFRTMWRQYFRHSWYYFGTQQATGEILSCFRIPAASRHSSDPHQKTALTVMIM